MLQMFFCRYHQRRSRRSRRAYRGFSLIELLIVVSIIMIIILFMLPQWRSHKINIDQASAINTIDQLRKAQVMYQSQYPSMGFACSLASLGPPPPGQPNGATSAGIIPSDVAAGAKDGYSFAIQDCKTQPNTNTVITYEIVAVPAVVGSTGNNAYCSDDSGPTKVDHSGNGPACVTGGVAP